MSKTEVECDELRRESVVKEEAISKLKSEITTLEKAKDKPK